MRTALTIAGSDSSGGAGIQADIKTMTANGVFAMSAVTALTAQNTTGVKDIMEVSPAFLKEQLDCVFTDIRPDAVKIGMVSSSELIRAIADKLKEYRAENIVVDPVMVATSGARLISEDAVETLKECLLPEADILTPNIPEAEVLSGMRICTEEDMICAGQKISETYHLAVLVKGGHQLNDANDLLCQGGVCRWILRKADRQPEHPWNRVHIVKRYCLQSGKGLFHGGIGGTGKNLHIRSAGSHAGSGKGQRTDEPCL